jgi:Fe2+ or Zn2+ uptake regulation protein
VYRALAADAAHPTADEVYRGVRLGHPSISPATVYRVLESLEREGLIRRVSSTGSTARFDARIEPHQHLVCRVCGRMIDVVAPLLSRMALPRGRVPGFVIESLDIRLVGRCNACGAGAATRRRRTLSSTAERRKPVGRERHLGVLSRTTAIVRRKHHA